MSPGQSQNRPSGECSPEQGAQARPRRPPSHRRNDAARRRTWSSSPPRWSPRRGRCRVGPARRPSGSRRRGRPAGPPGTGGAPTAVPSDKNDGITGELPHERHDLGLGDVRACRPPGLGPTLGAVADERHGATRLEEPVHGVEHLHAGGPVVGLPERDQPVGAGDEAAEVLGHPLDPPDAPPSRRLGPALALGEHPRIGIDGHRLVEGRCQLDHQDPRAGADVEQAPVTVERELALQCGEQRAGVGGAPRHVVAGGLTERAGVPRHADRAPRGRGGRGPPRPCRRSAPAPGPPIRPRSRAAARARGA